MPNEIDRLQNLVQEHEEYIANLELEAASTDNKIDGLAVLLGITPDTGNRRIIGIIKDEILRLQAKAVRLEREAEWLAHNARKGCPPVPPERLPDCDNEEHPHDCASCWREAARKAVEGKCQK